MIGRKLRAEEMYTLGSILRNYNESEIRIRKCEISVDGIESFLKAIDGIKVLP